jgi:hypothetical protein
MPLKEYIQLHGTEDRPGYGHFSLTTQEGDNEPQTQKVPVLKISNLPLQEAEFLREAFEVDDLPVAAYRCGPVGMGSFFVNPRLVLKAQGQMDVLYLRKVCTADEGTTNSITLSPENWSKGTIAGTTIHGVPLKATMSFVPSSKQ